MKKMYIKKKKKTNKIVLLIFLIIGTLYISFKYLNIKSREIFLDYSQIETKKVISEVIISSINNEVLNDIDLNKLFIIFKNSNDKIESIDLNSKYINYILNNITSILDQKLKELEQSKSIFEMPLFNNGIISNIFPKIPVRINIIGNTFCVINTNIESYGINNALFKVNLDVKVDVRILIPFVSEITSINTSVPIIIKLIEGEIPSYYFSDYFNKTYSN